MAKADIIDQEKVDRFLKMFPPRMKQLDNQIRLIGNCSNKSYYEWDFTKTEHSMHDDHSQAFLPHMDKENGTLISLNIEAVK